MKYSKHLERKSGISTVGIILILAVLGMVGYFVSPYFQAKVRVGWENLAEWTPERIQEEPDLYLKFAIQKCDETIETLKTSELTIRERQIECSRKLSEKQAEAKVHGQAVTNAKNSSPGEVTPEKKLKVVRAHRKVQNLNKLIKVYQKNEVKLDAALKELIKERDTTAQLKEELKTNLEIVKVEQVTAEITGTKQSLRSIMDRAEALAQMYDADAVLDGDAVGDVSPVTTAIDAEYDAIINGTN
jgi:hypothetical protein